MQVISLRFASNVSLTLVNDGDGWRFHGWLCRGDRMSREPTKEEKDLRFPDPDSAANYFRRRYAPEVKEYCPDPPSR